MIKFKIGTACVLSMLACCFLGAYTGISVLVGASIDIIPTLIFMWIFFGRSASKAFRPCQMTQRLYLGEIAKLLFAFLMFTLVFRWGRLNSLALFLSLIATQLGVIWAVIPRKTKDGL